MDVGLRKALSVSHYYPISSINFSLVCSFPIHKGSSANVKAVLFQLQFSVSVIVFDYTIFQLLLSFSYFFQFLFQLLL